MPTHPIVIATGNPHKVDELREIFAAQRIDVVGLKDLPGHESFREPIENGDSFEANAAIKALSYAQQTRRVCLADDSGIEIDALARMIEGVRTSRPGVISSHYSSDGEERGLSRPERDAANNARVLAELVGKAGDQRRARFVCVMALAGPMGEGEGLAGPGGVIHMTRGTFEGRIGEPPRVPAGGNGFGYDPLFLVGPEYAHTGAELETAQKNSMSHRARAGQAMAAWMSGPGKGSVAGGGGPGRGRQA